MITESWLLHDRFLCQILLFMVRVLTRAHHRAFQPRFWASDAVLLQSTIRLLCLRSCRREPPLSCMRQPINVPSSMGHQNCIRVWIELSDVSLLYHPALLATESTLLLWIDELIASEQKGARPQAQRYKLDAIFR